MHLYDSFLRDTFSGGAPNSQDSQTIDDGFILTGFFIDIHPFHLVSFRQIDHSRAASSTVDKSHGTRLSDQSMDETMRKPSAAKQKTDETKVPEPFDVRSTLTS